MLGDAQMRVRFVVNEHSYAAAALAGGIGRSPSGIIAWIEAPAFDYDLAFSTLSPPLHKMGGLAYGSYGATSALTVIGLCTRLSKSRGEG